MEDIPKTKEDIFPKLKDFNYYFLKKVEEQLKSSLVILEGGATSKSTSTAGNILATAAAIIPVVGRGVSGGIKQGDALLTQKLDQDMAISLSDIVYFHRNNREEARKTLIKAAYEIFSCYEMQFLQLTCNGGPTRAAQKLGYDAAERFLKYCVVNNVTVINEALIIKSIVCDTSNVLNSLGIVRSGRTVKDVGENSWKIAKIYTKVGVYDKTKATCYKNKSTNTKKYGHRVKFSYETISDDWKEDDLTYDYEQITDLNDFEVDYPIILEYIMKKDPEEFAKYDREIKHQQTLQIVMETQSTLLEDNEVKHQESQSTMVQLHQDLKGESTKQHDAVTQMLEEIKVNQEFIINELPKEPPPAYTVEPNAEAITQIVQQQIQEKEDQKIFPKIEKEIKEGLRKIDPTSTGEFKRLKKNVKKWF